MTYKIEFGTDGWRGIMAREFTFDNVSSSTKMLVGLENAGHMIPTLSCADMPWTAVLPEEYAPVFCGEAWPRAEALETIKHFTTAFLLTVVKDDSDARISLQKANVSVPNVVYDAAI